MRKISGLIIFISCTLSLEAFPIEVFLYDCTDDQLYMRHTELKIYRVDTSLVEKVYTSGGKVKIKRMKEGRYLIQYLNMFGQTQWKDFHVHKRKTKVYICINELIENNDTTHFEQLLPGDTIKIAYESNGCHHWINSTMLFYYENNVLKGIHEGRFNAKTIIDELKLNYLITFEKKLNAVSIRLGGCTTTETYLFQKNGALKIHVYDETCSWDGYHGLKKNIFEMEE